MKITYYGHSCFSVELDGKKLLFDPFIVPNEKAKDIDIKTIRADYILISHGHFDHTADAVALAKQNDATVVSNWEIVQWMQAQGHAKCHPMNLGGKWKFDFGTLKMVNAAHSSSFPDGSYAGNPCGFIIESDSGCFYYAGDTALTYDMKLYGKHHPLDLAILPLGDNFTMGVDDAVRAAKWLGVDDVMGVHFDTFGYIVIDHEQAVARFEKKGIRLHLPSMGETLEF